MCYNAYCLFKFKNPDEFINDAKRKRCKHIIKLAHALIKPCIDARFEKFRKQNFVGCKSQLMSSFKRTGANSTSSSKNTLSKPRVTA